MSTSTASVSAPTPSSSGRAGWTIATAIAPAVWGTTYIVTTRLLPEGHPLFAALMRSLPAGLIALLIARQVARGSWWWKSLVLGTLNMGAFFPLLFLAAQHLPGGVAATLGAAQPIVVAFLAVGILHERLSVWRIAWGIVGMVGVALVVLGPGAGLDPIGILAGLGGAVSMGTGVVLTKKWGRPEGVSAIGLAGWQLTAAGLVLLIDGLRLAVLRWCPALHSRPDRWRHGLPVAQNSWAIYLVISISVALGGVFAGKGAWPILIAATLAALISAGFSRLDDASTAASRTTEG